MDTHQLMHTHTHKYTYTRTSLFWHKDERCEHLPELLLIIIKCRLHLKPPPSLFSMDEKSYESLIDDRVEAPAIANLFYFWNKDGIY